MSEPIETRPYWAAEPDIKKFAPRLLERFAWWMSLLQRSGRWAKMRSVLSAYYGNGTDGFRDSSELKDAGEDGEVTELHINSIRPLVVNALSLICGVNPEVKPRARNTDAKTLAQTRLAMKLLKAIDQQLDSDEREVDTVRGGLLASSWSLGQAWMSRDGKEWARDENGRPVYTGSIDIFVLPPWRTVYDFAAADDSKRKWCFFRRPASRFDLAAQFESSGAPGAAEVARKLKSQLSDSSPMTWNGINIGATIAQLDVLLGENLPGEDVVWVWEMRHLPTPALPQGRLIRFVEPDIVLWDSLAERVGMPYSELHLYEFAPERVVTGGMGHTGTFDLGAMQEFLDLCTTSVATTVNINGQMHLWSPDSGPPSVHSLSTGNNVLSSQTKPEPLEYPALKPEVIAAADWVLSQARTSLALNDVVMGQPQKGMPASAQALQRAQAMQYHQVAQGQRLRLRLRNANGKLRLLQRFARSPQETEIVGDGDLYEMKQWQADDIADVPGFDVEPIDPMSASFEGRQALLELLMQMGAIRTPDALITFSQTGSIDAVTQVATAQRELVEQNVELLRRGVSPPPVDMQASMQAGAPVFIDPPDGREVLSILKSDPHHLSIPAYLGVMASPESRKDAAVVRACTEAITLSLQFWSQLTQDECAAFGVPPLPSQLMAAAPPVGAPEASPAEMSDTGSGPDIEQAKLPSPPENPLTGEKEDAGAVGLPA